MRGGGGGGGGGEDGEGKKNIHTKIYYLQILEISSFCHLLETSRRRRRRRRRKGRTEEEEDDEEKEGKVVLPNVGSFHLLQHPLPAPFPHLPDGEVGGAALQVSFALEDSPCHQVSLKQQ